MFIGFTGCGFVSRMDSAGRRPSLEWVSTLLMLGQSRDDEYGELRRCGRQPHRGTRFSVAVDDPQTPCTARVKASAPRIEMELHNTDYGSRDSPPDQKKISGASAPTRQRPAGNRWLPLIPALLRYLGG